MIGPDHPKRARLTKGLDARKASMSDSVEHPKQARAEVPMEPAAVPEKPGRSTKMFTTRSRRPWRTWRSARLGLARQASGTCGRSLCSRMQKETDMMFDHYILFKFIIRSFIT